MTLGVEVSVLVYSAVKMLVASVDNALDVRLAASFATNSAVLSSAPCMAERALFARE